MYLSPAQKRVLRRIKEKGSSEWCSGSRAGGASARMMARMKRDGLVTSLHTKGYESMTKSVEIKVKLFPSTNPFTLAAPEEIPLCSDKIPSHSWNGMRDTCQYRAALCVNGLPYCRKHAGRKLLNLHVLREEVKMANEALDEHLRKCSK